jgi:phenylpropionate dioxygenase-like ring-hydroxylating dioxygenase large terminal subunit
MIPRQWYLVLESREVKKGRLLATRRMGENLVFGRDAGGKVFCLVDRCAHRGAALSAGELVGDHVRCPFHGFEYDGEGRGVLIPANGKNTPVPERFRVPHYPAHEAHGFIFIWWGANPPRDLAAPFYFDDVDDSFSQRTRIDPWDCHYSRGIENQLDVVHLPFVHRTTIGRGNRTLVNGPVLEWKDPDHFWVRVFDVLDEGQKPLTPQEISPPYPDFHLDFHFPNLWQNWIAPDLRIVAGFVPVDDEHMLLYLREYQRFVRAPLLRGLVTRMVMPFNLVVAHQDRRVVVTQQPKASGLSIGENLVQGDGPIAAYRMRRDELMKAAAKG